MADAGTILRGLKAFGGVPDEAVARFAGLLERATFPSGHVLIAQGAEGDALFLLLRGHLEVSSDLGGDLVRLGPGALVGLVAVAGPTARAATATAVGEIEVARLSRAAYETLALKDPEVAVALELAIAAQLASDMRNIAQRVRDALTRGSGDAKRGYKDYDVVVIGAGPIGLAYANFVKKERPQTRIAVLDKQASPGFKIGESTLAPTVRLLRALGLPLPVIRRLLGPKTGLVFWWAGAESARPELPIAGHFEETFQVERSTLERAAISAARRRGIDVYNGTRVDIGRATLGALGNELVAEGPDRQEVRFRCHVVCDSSGLASLIPRTLGLYRKKIDSFNTNAYFAYFRKKSDVDLAFWEDSTTRHLCFPEGWVWFIDIESWDKAPEENLSAMIDYLLDHPDGPDESYPSRRELSEKFDCPLETIVSIGIVPRSDIDTSSKAPIEARFQHYVDKYPALKYIMDNYELIEAPYEGHPKFSAFVKMAHDSERVTGDGWVAVGDAAMFVNPLFSPGLAFGAGTAYMAAQGTIEALARNDFSQLSFATYEQYARDVFASLLRENEMHYRGFMHPDSYESTWMIKFAMSAFQIAASQESPLPEGFPWSPLLVATGDYTANDPFELAVLNPVYLDVVGAMFEALRSGQESGEDSDVTAAKVRQVLDGMVDNLRAIGVLDRGQIGRVFKPFSDEAVRLDDHPERPRLLPRWTCTNCRTAVLQEIRRCYVCGFPPPDEGTP